MSDTPVDAAIDAAGDHETTNDTEKQPLTEPTGAAPTQPDNWEGDKRYFQTGKKAGQLKPSADAAIPAQLPTLDFGDLNATAKQPQQAAAQPEQKSEKAKAKAEKKDGEARIASKIVMQSLDAIVMWISGGTYGADFNDTQKTARNKYREELEENWRLYLITLDIPLHPALVCLASSTFYVLPALDTPRGIERTASLKEKIFGKIGMALFRRGKK